jgi:hypothetical protein
MKVYLRVYRLDRMISPYVDMLQRTVCQWNHCSIRIDNIIIHFFDDYVIPRWITIPTDVKLYKNSQEFYVGECTDLPAVRNFTNSFLPMTRYQKAVRQLWFYSFGLWPKRNDCVDKCSATLTYLFNTPRCYTTPDKLVEIVNEYRNQRIR